MLTLSLTAHAAERPNIILMMADDLGWGDVGFNGNTVIQTPELDAMAANGLRFSRFYASSPMCSPTRGSCMTGRHPYRYDIHSANDGHMKPEELTLAELLKEHGYTTGHFGKWHLGTLAPNWSGKANKDPKVDHSNPGMNGFDEWFSTEFAVATWDPYAPENSHLKGDVAWDPRALYWHNGKNIEGGLEGDDSRIIMDKALPFIETAAKNERPFFTVIWFHAPHSPVVGGPEYLAMYEDHDEDARHYYACITAMDEQIGRLRRALRDLGVAENTALFFCSDNGPEGPAPKDRNMGSAGPFRGRKRSLFEGGVRVPGLVEWPGHVKPGTETAYPAVTSDYLPTVLALINVAMPDPRPLDGISLVPVLDGEGSDRPAPIAFRTNQPKASPVTAMSPVYALSDQRYKFLSDFNESPDLLFDLLADPGETRNIAKDHPETATAMKAQLAAWVESCARSEAGADY